MDQHDKSNATDLHSLRDLVEPPPLNRRQSPVRSLADGIVDMLIPIMIFCMMLSVTWFLLDIRFVYTERLDLNMRVFTFFFVLGIVALNRLRAERGWGNSAVYVVGMVFAVGVFTILSQLRGGGVAGGYLVSMVPSLCFNVSVVVILWRVTDRLMRDCCVDARSHGGDEGIMGRAWPWKKAPPPEAKTEATQVAGEANPSRPPRKHPANALFYLALPIMAILALGQRILPQGGGFLDSAGSVYVGCYTASMLMLLLLSSYRGLRVYCVRREIRFPTGIAAFWLGLGTVMVALVFLLGLWGPVPPSPEPTQQRARSYGSGGRTLSDRWDYHEHQRNDGSGDSAPSQGEGGQGNQTSGKNDGQQEPNGAEGPHKGSEQGSEGGRGQGGGENGETSGNDGNAQNQAQTQDRQGQRGETSRGETPQNPQESGQEQSGQRASGSPNSSPPKAEIPMNQLMNAFPALKWLGYGALVLVGLFLLYLLLQTAAHFFGHASRSRSRFARLFDRLARLFRRLTYVPKRKPRRARVRIDRDIATCARYQNPLDGPLPLREKIQYSYDALCALAYDLGVPREEAQTPFEFLAKLPEPIADIQQEAHVLTHLYVAGSYSTLEIPVSVMDDLRDFWRRFERMRSKVIR